MKKKDSIDLNDYTLEELEHLMEERSIMDEIIQIFEKVPVGEILEITPTKKVRSLSNGCVLGVFKVGGIEMTVKTMRPMIFSNQELDIHNTPWGECLNLKNYDRLGNYILTEGSVPKKIRVVKKYKTLMPSNESIPQIIKEGYAKFGINLKTAKKFPTVHYLMEGDEKYIMPHQVIIEIVEK